MKINRPPFLGRRPCVLPAQGNALALLLIAFTASATAQPAPRWANELEQVGITEHLEAQVPLDLPFIDTDGREVTLGDYFDGRRPVILTMNYSKCAQLCSQQLNGLVHAMRELSWDLGDKYQVVTVVIDPREPVARAAATQRKYLADYGRAGTDEGWHFLTGREENIRKVADTVGFGYAYVPKDDQYAHMAVLMICTPEGRVARYIGGVQYDPQTLKLSLLEASEGRVGSTMDLMLLYCYHFDPETNRYGPSALRIMRIGGLLTVALLGGLLSVYWVRESRRRRTASKEAA